MSNIGVRSRWRFEKFGLACCPLIVQCTLDVRWMQDYCCGTGLSPSSEPTKTAAKRPVRGELLISGSKVRVLVRPPNGRQDYWLTGSAGPRHLPFAMRSPKNSVNRPTAPRIRPAKQWVEPVRDV